MAVCEVRMSIAVQDAETKSVETTPLSSAASPKDAIDSMPWLPCMLTLDVPVPGFTVGDLMTLREGSIVATGCNQTSDVPLRVNQLLIGWTEFEVIDDRLAVRITDQL
jgi:flagellar motor switch protein FliN/FliY